MIVRVVVMVAAVGLALATPVFAADAKETFSKHVLVVSLEGGFGDQLNHEDHRLRTNIEFWNTGIRFSLLPFGVSFDGSPLKGALEVGLEPFYQQYTHPRDAHYVGLGAAARYHFLALGRLVPYVELFLAAGSSDLRTREIDSDLAFLLQGGAGLSIFLTDHTAFYGGYRFQHVSNGNTSLPNRGFESHSGVFGVSVFFP
jgi:opacity protein-like surface antigen